MQTYPLKEGEHPKGSCKIVCKKPDDRRRRRKRQNIYNYLVNKTKITSFLRRAAEANDEKGSKNEDDKQIKKVYVYF